MISTSALRASAAVQCGFGWVSGTPGASTSAATFDQSSVAQILRLEAGGLRVGELLVVVVEGDDLGAARDQRARRQQPRTAEAEDRDLLARRRW